MIAQIIHAYAKKHVLAGTIQIASLGAWAITKSDALFILSAVSGCMIICINFKSFMASDPVIWLKNIFRKDT